MSRTEFKEALKFRIQSAERHIEFNNKTIDALQQRIKALNEYNNETTEEIRKGHELLAEIDKEEFAEKADRGAGVKNEEGS